MAVKLSFKIDEDGLVYEGARLLGHIARLLFDKHLAVTKWWKQFLERED